MITNVSTLNEMTGRILDAATEVHRTLGPGLLESTYLHCLQLELVACKLRFVPQHTVPIVYKGTALAASYRVDLIVEERIVVEVKALVSIEPVHQAQLLTYLRLTRCPVGLLINFNVPRLMEGVKRMINVGSVGGNGEGGGRRGGSDNGSTQGHTDTEVH